MNTSGRFPHHRALPALANLAQLKRQARELQDAFDKGDAAARALVAHHLTAHANDEKLKLAHAQLVVARVHAFASWSRLKHHVEARSWSDAEVGDVLLRALFESNDHVLAALHERCRALPPDSIHLAAALADLDALDGFLAQSPASARMPGGPLGTEPLVYLCHARFQALEAGFAARQLQVAKRLLAQGANPNATGWREGNDRPVSALYGTVRGPGNPALCELLLDHGAKVSDGESLYHACELRDLRCLELLLAHGPDDDDREWCIVRMIGHENVAGVRLFLEHGTSPNHLCEALFRERSIECIRLLVEHGVDVNVRCKANWLLERVDGLTPLQIAERNGDEAAVALLLGAGARDKRTPVDYLISACVRHDEEWIARLLTEHPNLEGHLSANDHKFLASVARTGNLKAVDLMLDVGFDIEAKADDAVAPALCYAALVGNADMVELLIARDADLEATNKFGGNALGNAVWAAVNMPSPSGDYPACVELLLRNGFTPNDSMLAYVVDHGRYDVAEKLTQSIDNGA